MAEAVLRYDTAPDTDLPEPYLPDNSIDRGCGPRPGDKCVVVNCPFRYDLLFSVDFFFLSCFCVFFPSFLFCCYCYCGCCVSFFLSFFFFFFFFFLSFFLSFFFLSFYHFYLSFLLRFSSSCFCFCFSFFVIRCFFSVILCLYLWGFLSFFFKVMNEARLT